MVSCMIIISLLLLVYSSSNGLMYDYYSSIITSI